MRCNALRTHPHDKLPLAALPHSETHFSGHVQEGCSVNYYALCFQRMQLCLVSSCRLRTRENVCNDIPRNFILFGLTRRETAFEGGGSFVAQSMAGLFSTSLTLYCGSCVFPVHSAATGDAEVVRLLLNMSLSRSTPGRVGCERVSSPSLREHVYRQRDM